MNWYDKLNAYFPVEEMKSKSQLDALLEEKGDIYHKEEGPYHIIMYAEFEDFIFIDFLWVSEEARGKGIGKQVMESLKRKNKPIMLEVEPVNVEDLDTEKRIRFYKKQGFQVIEAINYLFQAFMSKTETKLDIMCWSDSNISEKEVYEKMKLVYEEIHTYKVEEIYGVTAKPTKNVINIAKVSGQGEQS